MSTVVPHQVSGSTTTFYACAECGACPCPEHNRDHAQECSARVPDEWRDEECALATGRNSFMTCSRCQFPPCHYRA